MKPTFLLSLFAILSATPLLSHAAPARTKDVIIQLDASGDVDAAISYVVSLYTAHGLSDVRSRLRRIQVGSTFHAVTLPDGGSSLRTQLARASPGIVRVEQERQWQLFDTQVGASAGLDRLDSQNALDGKYTYPASAGHGVDVYVIDSGCDVKHPDFEGRATLLGDLSGEGAFDGHGHGTHVAGTIAGKTFGVAKKATIHCIKVFDQSGEGPNSAVLSALELVSRKVSAQPTRKAVVNMSLGGPKSGDARQETAMSSAINALTAQGVAVVVAAGNNAVDACTFSPAFIQSALTVGALNPRDNAIADFSNYGTCVDLFAPGVDILSARAGGTDGVEMSGTSMAAPHVSGAMAVLLGQGMTRGQAQAKVTGMALRGRVVGNLRGSPNVALYMGGLS